jgi:glycosyltransferase involved in cell wall biosynthesis
VLYIDNTSTFGGAFTSLVHLLRALEGGPVRPVLATGQPRESVARALGALPSYHVRPVRHWVEEGWFRRLAATPPFRRRVLRRSLAATRLMYWAAARIVPEALRYRAIARRHRVRVVHLNNAPTQSAGLLAARWLRVPCVAHTRGFLDASGSTRWHCRLVDHHIAISAAIRADLVAAGAPVNRVSVVHDAVGLEEFDPGVDAAPLRREFGLGEADRAFGIFGRVVPWKGTLEFVHAAHRVVRALPDARAFVVGDVSDGDSAYLDEVRAAVRALRLGDRVVFTGYRPEVPALMNLMDVVVHASLEPEPFGMVLIEGMALGKPIVATRGGGPDEIVQPGKTGLLVPRGDTDALADAILALLGDPARAAAMGRAGHARARALFSSQRYAREVEAIYRHVLGARPPRAANGTQ